MNTVFSDIDYFYFFHFLLNMDISRKNTIFWDILFKNSISLITRCISTFRVKISCKCLGKYRHIEEGKVIYRALIEKWYFNINSLIIHIPRKIRIFWAHFLKNLILLISRQISTFIIGLLEITFKKKKKRLVFDI